MAMQSYVQPGVVAPFGSVGPRTFHQAPPPGYVGPIPPGQHLGPVLSQQLHPWPPRRPFCNGATIAISILAALAVLAVAMFVLQRSGQQVQATPAPMPAAAPLFPAVASAPVPQPQPQVTPAVAPALRTVPQFQPQVAQAVPAPQTVPQSQPQVAQAASSSGAPQDMLALVDQVGDANALKRGMVHTPQRKIMNEIWKGAHTAKGNFGPVVLSEKAKQLRAALIQRGFQPRVMFHGTETRLAPLILDNGFRFAAIGWRGNGIYVASHESHAMCYGNALIAVEAFWKEPKDKYLKHVPSDNEMDDVSKIMDPLLAFPKSVRHITGADMANSTCI